MSLRKEITTTRLDFGEGDWIEVKETRNYGDTVHAQRAAAIRRIVPSESKDDKDDKDDQSDDAGDFDFNVVDFNLALLERMIVAWSDPADITQETIQELPNKTVQKVLAIITEGIAESESEEAKKE